MLSRPLSTYPLQVRPVLVVVRLIAALLRDVFDEQLTLRATSLVYTTLLSLVPLLALSFSVLKGFGVHNQLEPMLLNLLQPLGGKSADVTNRILEFVSNLDVRVLGAVGLAVLFYTVFSLMQKVVNAIDFAWDYQGRRSYAQRFTDYMAMLLIGPVLIFSVAGAMTGLVELPWMQSLLNVELIGQMYSLMLRWLPFVLMVITLGFVYWFLPSLPVRWYAALAGGVSAALIWKGLGWFFAIFVAESSRYAAIYSAFATILLFMLWLYLSWLVFLLGARVAFYVQFPQNIASRLSPACRGQVETLGLQLIYLIIRRFYEGDVAASARELANLIHVPLSSVSPVLDLLVKHKILLIVEGAIPRYAVARAPETLYLKDVVELLRGHICPQTMGLRQDAPVEQVLKEINGAVAEHLEGINLSTWVNPQTKGLESVES